MAGASKMGAAIGRLLDYSQGGGVPHWGLLAYTSGNESGLAYWQADDGLEEQTIGHGARLLQ